MPLLVMLKEIYEIKEIRKKLGLTQKQLAQRANVSQSLIAKIESGKISPSYSIVKQIFSVLERAKDIKEVKAENVMNKKVISLKPHDSISTAVKKMKKYDISQIPVIIRNKPIGLVTESDLLEAVTEKKVKYVSSIMEEAPPMVSKKTNLNVVSSLLKYYPIVLISSKGKIVGVITKSDVLASRF